MTYLYELECFSQEELIKHEDETSGVETLTRWTIGTLKNTNKASYNTTYVRNELVLDKEYFVVVAKWSDNNDWNVHHLNKLNVLGLFDNYEAAQKLADSIESHHQKHLTTQQKDNISLNERLFYEHQKLKMPTPWNAYFKILDQVKVEKVKYDNGKKNKIKNRL